MKRYRIGKLEKNKYGWLQANFNHDNHYLVVNVDESYAEQVFELIKAHEQAKGTWDGPETFEGYVKELKS